MGRLPGNDTVWSLVAAILMGLAAIITAEGGLLVVLHHIGYYDGKKESAVDPTTRECMMDKEECDRMMKKQQPGSESDG